jgi:(5-formylfuran-3-yl)methyl phosphate synthase
MTGLLVSVSNLAEAETAISADVDILDMKNPAEGALGRLKLETIADIAAICQGSVVSSATIGDLPMQPALLATEVERVIEAGVDIVKIGFFGQGWHEDCAAAIGRIGKGRVKLIAVMMADQSPDFSMLETLKSAGFYGVMLDTAIKDGKCLLDHQSINALSDFCRLAKAQGMVVGLAGSLNSTHIQDLVKLTPDYLGFRGAVCHQTSRTADLELDKILSIKKLLHLYNSTSRHNGHVRNITVDMHCT